jgi:hypothetical protein
MPRAKGHPRLGSSSDAGSLKSWMLEVGMTAERIATGDAGPFAQGERGIICDML